jgi:streptogramin lyase
VGVSMIAVPRLPHTVAYSVREYLLPHPGTPEAYAHDPAVGADGIVWFADQNSSYSGRLDPETGDVKEFPTRTGIGPARIVAPDGAVAYGELKKD